MILLGHNNILSRQLLSEIKNNKIKLDYGMRIMFKLRSELEK